MDNLNRILSDINVSSLSSIAEIETGIHLDQAQFKKRIQDRVIKFQEYSLESGHCVILQKANSIDFFLDFLALFFMNVTIIPLDPASSIKEVEILTAFSGASLVISENKLLFPSNPKQHELIGIALVLFTSGTTSSPKGVKISKVALEKKIEILNQNIGQEAVENTLCFVSTFFGHGLICNSLFPIFKGKNFYISKKMSLELVMNFSEILKEKKITFFSSVPGHWEMLLEFSELPIESNLKRVNCASAPLNEHKIKRILAWLGGKPLYDVYGATEMLGWFADNKIINEKVAIEFRNFWDVDSKTNLEGELLIKSSYMFSGYWTKGSEPKEEFFNTGDIFIDNKISGRTKNTINKSGIKIQIEDVVHDFMESGLVNDAAAFPIDDKFTGQQIGLFIVLGNAKLEAVTAYASKNISILRHPSEIIVLDKIPLNSRGKTSTRLLVTTYKELKETDEKILAVFNKIFKTNHTTTNLERSNILNWDSMRHAELIINLQKIFKIKFTVKDINNVENLNSISEQIKKLLAESNAS